MQCLDHRRITGLVCWLSSAMTSVSTFGTITPQPDKVAPAVADVQDFQIPDRVQLSGWVGTRVAANEANRLAKIDPGRLLEGFRKRPGRQTWDGEHVGKWMHAATLAWVNTGDPALRKKLDDTVAELLKCQLEDGYLGTYLEKDRWVAWDVWAHKYNLIGLITYMRYTGNTAPLPTCRKMADLLCTVFGDEAGKRNILKAGEHMGMAPTSVLEPMVLLYRLTGEQRYLDFCKYILRAWETPEGPRIVSTLLNAKRVDKVGNSKAYEMLSCMNGALEYYRTVGGDRKILDACLNGWQDIVDKRLYITGAASRNEHFEDDFVLPNVANVGETCVTVTWLQFNAHLLRLTGEARFAEQLERVILNQLMGAQRPDGAAWGYYVQMEGTKPYSSELFGHCCLSSGPRGVALVPTFAVTTDADGLVVNLYDAAKAELALRDGTAVRLAIETLFPSSERIVISIDPSAKKLFAVKLRIPTWCPKATAQVNGQAQDIKPGADGYAAISRTWESGDKIELNLKLEGRVIVGDHMQAGKAAVLYGPLVLTADEAYLPQQARTIGTIALAGSNADALAVTPQPAEGDAKTWLGAQVFKVSAVARRPGGTPFDIRMVPFADAGAAGSRYRIWLPLPSAKGASLLLGGDESRSRKGNIAGSINDDPPSPVCTFDGKPAQEDWYAVTMDTSVAIRRIVYRHGKSFHDGGWFDASAGKPQVQIRKEKDGQWETVGTLDEYPATTATDNKGVKENQEFTLRLPQPLKVFGVRVIGKPACGDNPAQAFTTCGALLAFDD